MLNCNCTISKVSFTEKVIIMMLKADMTPARVEELAALNGGSLLTLTLEVVQPDLFEGRIEGAPRIERCVCGHSKEQHTLGVLTCLCPVGVGKGACPCEKFEDAPPVNVPVACGTCGHYASFHRKDGGCAAPPECACPVMIYPPDDGGNDGQTAHP